MGEGSILSDPTDATQTRKIDSTNPTSVHTIPITMPTENEFLALGLDTANIVGWSRCAESTNLARFKTYYGVILATCVKMWEELSAADDDTIRISEKEKPRNLFLVFASELRNRAKHWPILWH